MTIKVSGAWNMTRLATLAVSASIAVCAFVAVPAKAQFPQLPTTVKNLKVTRGANTYASWQTALPCPSAGPAFDSYDFEVHLNTSSLPQPINFSGVREDSGLGLGMSFLDANGTIIGSGSTGAESFTAPLGQLSGIFSEVVYHKAPCEIFTDFAFWGLAMQNLHSQHLEATQYIQVFAVISGHVLPNDLTYNPPGMVQGTYVLPGAPNGILVGYWKRPTTGWPSP